MVVNRCRYHLETMSLIVCFTWLLLLCHETGGIGFGSLKPSNPSFVREGGNITLKWNYTIDGSIGGAQFFNATDDALIAAKFGDGDVIVASDYQERFKADVSNTLAQLTIITVERSDSGWYRFTLASGSPNLDTISDEVELKVRSPVLLTKVSEDQAVLEGSNTTLFCEATGQPKPDITLTRLLEDGSDGEVLSPQPTWNFPNISRTDSGTYRCTAKNAFENVSQVFKVNVTYPAKIVKLVSEHNVTSQQSVSLVCQAEGNPEPTYSWTPCDSKQNMCHESLLNFKAGDKSVYTFTCKVENYLGNDTGNAIVFIASDVINVTLVITGEDCTDGENNQLWEKLRKMIEEIFAGKLGYESVQLKRIRCGSVIVDIALKFSSTVREHDALSVLENAVKNAEFGELNVSAITGTRDTGKTPTMATTSTSSSDSKTWIIVGVVVGVAAVLAVAGGVAWYVYKKRKCKKRDSKVHNNGSQGEAGGNVQVNKGYEDRANRRSRSGETSSAPPAVYDTAQTGNRGAVRGQPAPQYAVVDKSKKKPRKPQPGELQYAELAEFSTGQGGQRSSLSPTNRHTETQYADVNAM